MARRQTVPEGTPLPATPARVHLVALATAAIATARRRGLTPASVYLTRASADACRLAVGRAGSGDPPRVLGLPIRLTTSPSGNRLYTSCGKAIGFACIMKALA